MRMASGRAPSAGRKRPPMMPGPRISRSNSLPLDMYVAARNIRYPYTSKRKRFPSAVVVQGSTP